MATVARLSVTPVKGTALQHPHRVELTPTGAASDRRFHLVDDAGRLVNGKRLGALHRLRCDYDAGADVLTVTLPDGEPVQAPVQLSGERVTTTFSGRPVAGSVVDGPFAAAISAAVGRPLRLVRPDPVRSAVDAYPVSLVSTATLESARSAAGAPAEGWADRFRMLIEVDRVEPLAEEAWQGAEVAVGQAVLDVVEPVPRCAVTTQQPGVGVKDFDTLTALRGWRAAPDEAGADEAALLGMYAEVRRPGTVCLGDPVQPA